MRPIAVSLSPFGVELLCCGQTSFGPGLLLCLKKAAGETSWNVKA